MTQDRLAEVPHRLAALELLRSKPEEVKEAAAHMILEDPAKFQAIITEVAAEVAVMCELWDTEVAATIIEAAVGYVERRPENYPRIVGKIVEGMVKKPTTAIIDQTAGHVLDKPQYHAYIVDKVVKNLVQEATDAQLPGGDRRSKAWRRRQLTLKNLVQEAASQLWRRKPKAAKKLKLKHTSCGEETPDTRQNRMSL